jgi:hypothetical protein
VNCPLSFDLPFASDSNYRDRWLFFVYGLTIPTDDFVQRVAILFNQNLLIYFQAVTLILSCFQNMSSEFVSISNSNV